MPDMIQCSNSIHRLLHLSKTPIATLHRIRRRWKLFVVQKRKTPANRRRFQLLQQRRQIFESLHTLPQLAQLIQCRRPTATTIIQSVDYGELGRPQIRRASHVEPTDDGRWTADLSPVDGPVLGPFDKRDEALDAEIEWLNLMMNQFDPLDEQLV